MRVRTGDVFAAYHPGSMATVIPVSCDVDKKTLVALMGTGLGKKAGKTWSEVPRGLGKMLDIGGAHTYVVPCTRQPNEWTVCLPIKYSWNQKADIPLISRCVEELVALADVYGWEKVFLPRLGTGQHDHPWEPVRAVIKPLLDDRFVVVHDPVFDAPPPAEGPKKVAVKVGAVSGAAKKRMRKKVAS